VDPDYADARRDRESARARARAGNVLRVGFFAVGASAHHILYLVPFMRCCAGAELALFQAEPAYREHLVQAFPEIKIAALHEADAEAAIRYLEQFSILIFASSYPWFAEHIRPRLRDDIVLVRVMHGAGHKFVDDRNYIFGSVHGWDCSVVAGRKALDILYHHLGTEKERRVYDNPITLIGPGGRSCKVIQSGNLRVRDYTQAHQTGRGRAGLGPGTDTVPRVKNLLYMSTYSWNYNLERSDFSALPFFIELLRAMPRLDRYALAISLHPNLRWERELLADLRDVLAARGLANESIEFDGDYLPLMAAADLLITDRTSAAMDFLYFDKPIVFLDHEGICPAAIALEDVTESYWSYRNGPVVGPDNADAFESVVERAIEADTHAAIRADSRDYSFNDSVTPEDVLRMIATHPKLDALSRPSTPE
jgi:hypothetical protein